jgi:hypothetical protein
MGVFCGRHGKNGRRKRGEQKHLELALEGSAEKMNAGYSILFNVKSIRRVSRGARAMSDEAKFRISAAQNTRKKMNQA